MLRGENEERRVSLRRARGECGCRGSSQEGVTGSVDGVEHAPLVPLHVSDAPHRLDLGDLGAKLIVVLELALFKQVLVASVSGVLVAHPAGDPQSKKGDK